MEVNSSIKHQAFKIGFMYYLSTILSYQNFKNLVFSGRLFLCKKMSFCLAKVRFPRQLAVIWTTGFMPVLASSTVYLVTEIYGKWKILEYGVYLRQKKFFPTFLGKFGKNNKTVRLRWNLLPRLIQIC